MKHVYIAGPYTAPTPEGIQANVDAAIDAGNRLLDAGIWPYVPHLSHYQHARKPRHYEQWMALDFAWLKRCDAILRLPGSSSGADREVELAQRYQLPVLRSVEGVIRHVHGEPAKEPTDCAWCGRLLGSGQKRYCCGQCRKADESDHA